MNYLLKTISLFILLKICLVSEIVSAEDEEPKITFSKINENFWVLHGGNGLGANVGLSVGDDGILLIDAMNLGKDKLLLKAIRSVSDKPIKYVINTHQHRDHSGGNEALVAQGATIIYPDYIKYTDYEGANQEIQFKNKLSLKFNGENFELYHVKSHTWNDVIIHMRNTNAVFTGDNHATSWGPNIGVRGEKSHRNVFDLVLSLSDDKTLVVPGHTALADLEHVRQYDKKTQEWFDYIRSSYKKGMSAESIAKSPRIVSLFTWFHGGKFPTWLSEANQIIRVKNSILLEGDKTIELPLEKIKNYLGFYQLKDGSSVEIINHNKELYVFKDNAFMAHLLARTRSHFDIVGWTDDEELNFSFDKNGNPNQLNYLVNGNLKFIANKIANKK